jgi:hypothetical protein
MALPSALHSGLGIYVGKSSGNDGVVVMETSTMIVNRRVVVLRPDGLWELGHGFWAGPTPTAAEGFRLVRETPRALFYEPLPGIIVAPLAETSEDTL